MSTVTTRGEDSLLARLVEVARALHGLDWQSAAARDLGALHPRGARRSLDVRLVQRWAAGSRPVPAWLEGALPVMLASGLARRRGEIAALERLAARLG